MGKKKKRAEPSPGALGVKRGDTVIVLSGDDKGRTGKVLAVYPKRWRIVVEKVNFVKRHTKSRTAGKQSGILEKEAPLHVSKVALWDSKADKGVRVGFRRSNDGKTRERISRATGEVVGS